MLVRHLSGGDLTEYADGEMTGARRRRAQEHLGRCERCTGALEATWDAVEALRAAPAAIVPDDLRERFAARVSSEAPRPVSCRTVLNLIQQDLDGVLSPLSAGLLRLHLDDCPACWQQHRTLAAATRLVRSLPPTPAPAGLWERAIAGRRARPAVSWGIRLRPALAAAAMAAGALAFGLHSLPPRSSHPVSPPVSRQVAAQPLNAAPLAAGPEAGSIRVQPEPAPVRTADAALAVSRMAPKPVAAAVRQRPSGVVRTTVERTSELVSPPMVVAAVAPREASKVEAVPAAPRKSRGLQALAMMAKAVSSESEGRVSLAQGLEPWMVTGQEMSSEAPPAAARPADAPGAGSPSSPNRSNTGARDLRPGWAGVIGGAA